MDVYCVNKLERETKYSFFAHERADRTQTNRRDDVPVETERRASPAAQVFAHFEFHGLKQIGAW